MRRDLQALGLRRLMPEGLVQPQSLLLEGLVRRPLARDRQEDLVRPQLQEDLGPQHLQRQPLHQRGIPHPRCLHLRSGYPSLTDQCCSAR